MGVVESLLCAISDAQGWVCIVDASHEGEVQGGAGSTGMEPAKTKGMFSLFAHCAFALLLLSR